MVALKLYVCFFYCTVSYIEDPNSSYAHSQNLRNQ